MNIGSIIRPDLGKAVWFIAGAFLLPKILAVVKR